jgi:DNA-binding NarL/FixJ family response regulator
MENNVKAMSVAQADSANAERAARVDLAAAFRLVALPPQLMNLVIGNQHIPSKTTRPMLLGEPSIEAHEHYSPKLSLKETRILRRLISGDSNKTIERNCSIAEATVKVHVKPIPRKIRVRNRTQAAIWAINNPSSMVGTTERLLAVPMKQQRFIGLMMNEVKPSPGNGGAHFH